MGTGLFKIASSKWDTPPHNAGRPQWPDQTRILPNVWSDLQQCVCVCMCVHVHMSGCVCVYMHECVCVCVCIYICMSVCVCVCE